jgi:hypothetical protein
MVTAIGGGLMPIPEGHRQRLEENLAAQERWLRSLRRHIDGLQDEVSAYETMIALGRDQALLEVLEDLYDRPELFESAADDPRAFLEERSVRVPDNAAVTVKTVTENRSPRRYAVEARFHTKTLTYRAGWSPRAGFYATAEPPSPDARDEEARTCR